jgi:Na+-driven multidrug efflux pump
MFLSLCHQFIVFIPALLIFSTWWGLKGVWISMPISDLLGTTVSTIWIFYEYRKQKRSAYWKQPAAVPAAKVETAE